MERVARDARTEGLAVRPVRAAHPKEPKVKQYVLNIIQPATGSPPAEVLARIMRDVDELIQETKTTGSWVFNGGLTAPGSATVVRYRDGAALLTDGPFTEGKECIGGFVVVRAPDLDAALEWAKKLSRATTLPVEVRAFHGEG